MFGLFSAWLSFDSTVETPNGPKAIENLSRRLEVPAAPFDRNQSRLPVGESPSNPKGALEGFAPNVGTASPEETATDRPNEDAAKHRHDKTPSPAAEADVGDVLLFNGRDLLGWEGSPDGQVFDPSVVFRIERTHLAWTGTRGRIIHTKSLKDCALKFDYLIPVQGASGDGVGVAFPNLCSRESRLTILKARPVALDKSDSCSRADGKGQDNGWIRETLFTTRRLPVRAIIPRLESVPSRLRLDNGTKHRSDAKELSSGFYSMAKR